MENERLFRIVSELWAHTWASGTEPHFEQPYGAFDATKGGWDSAYVFHVMDDVVLRGLDTMPCSLGVICSAELYSSSTFAHLAQATLFNFRMPNRINEKLPTQNGQMFQKGLIPHVDINPYEMFTWR